MVTNILPPLGVNLMALDKRFKMTLSIKSGSKVIIFSSQSVSKVRDNPLSFTYETADKLIFSTTLISSFTKLILKQQVSSLLISIRFSISLVKVFVLCLIIFKYFM